jgi:uncharacterized protein (TIGR02996 family)
MAPSLVPAVRAALEEIRERPDDDAPRLMLADWLEENGDTLDQVRATLLREQCAQVARDPADPLRLADRVRIEDLLLRNGDALGSSEFARRATWERGLREVKVNSGELEALLARPDLLAWTSRLTCAGQLRADEELSRLIHPAGAQRLRQALGTVRQLTLKLGEATVEWLAALSGAEFSRLTHLDVRGTIRNGNGPDHLLNAGPVPLLLTLRCHHVDLPRLARGEVTPALRELRLGFWSASLDPLFASQRLRHLERVELVASQRRELSFPRREGLPAFRSLRVTGLAEGVLGAVVDAPFWPRLEELELPHQAVAVEHLRSLAQDRCGIRLRKLDLEQCQIYSPGAEMLTWARWPELETLLLRRNVLGPEGAGHLARGDFERLRRLDLASCGLGSGGAVNLATAPWLGNLRYLDLGWNGIEQAGLHALLQRDWPDLRDLDLDENRLGDAGVRELHALESFAPNLIGLHLKGNQITDAGARWLAMWPFLRQLRVLDLQVNRIGEAGGRALLESPYTQSLQWLALGINDLSNDLRQAFQARFGYRVVIP